MMFKAQKSSVLACKAKTTYKHCWFDFNTVGNVFPCSTLPKVTSVV